MKRLPIAIALMTIVALVGAFATRPAAAQSEGTIAGIVYLDENRNGERDTGEDGLLDIEVNFATSGWDTTINTDSAGAFDIDLNPATWTVSVLVPEGQYEATTDESIEVLIESAGDAETGLEFGLAVAQASGDGDGDDEVLPDSGAPISETTLIIGLVGLITLGGVMVYFGQRKGTAAV